MANGERARPQPIGRDLAERPKNRRSDQNCSIAAVPTWLLSRSHHAFSRKRKRALGITGLFNLEIGLRARSNVRDLYEDTLRLKGLPDACPRGNFSVAVGPSNSPIAAKVTFGGTGTAIRAITLAIGRGEIAKWRARLQSHGVNLIGSAWQFDEEYLCFVDDADFDLAMAEVDEWDGVPKSKIDPTILGIKSVEIEAGFSGELEKLLAVVGLKTVGEEGPIVRYEVGVPRFAIDVFRSTGASFKHQSACNEPQRINFELADQVAVDALQDRIRGSGFDTVPLYDWSGAFAVRLRTLWNLQIGFLARNAALGRPISQTADR